LENLTAHGNPEGFRAPALLGGNASPVTAKALENLHDLPLRTVANIYLNDFATLYRPLRWLTAQNALV
jgi:hypothetical protein